jgi:hypothetical protein
MICHIKSGRKLFLAFCPLCYIDALPHRVLYRIIFRGDCHFFSSLPVFLTTKETNTLEHIHETSKLKYQILPSQRCNVRGLKLGLSYNNGL